MLADINNYFLATSIKEPEYMMVKYHYLSIMKKRYNLDVLVMKDDCICIRIQKGRPKLKQVVILAHKHLKWCLLLCRYVSIYSTIGL